MDLKNKDVDTLREAFSHFTATSTELERSYRLLKTEVGRLKSALRASNLEKAWLREEAERNHRLAAVGEMAARMAHELRNPLGSIELFSALLMKKHVDDAEKKDWANHLSSAIRSMDYAISNFLLYTGKPVPKIKKVNLRALVRSLRPYVTNLVRQKQLSWVEDMDPKTKFIPCDKDLLRQVLVNLILNAIEAAPQHGCVRISSATTEGDAGKVSIFVSDSGPGIEDEKINRIFDPFFTTKEKGTGLGLSIVQNAVAAHHGTIRVAREDQTTQFIVSLPLYSEDA